MPPLNNPYRKFHHIPLQPPISANLDPVDGDHLIFNADSNVFESLQPEAEVVDYINFNTSYVDGSVEGRLQWNPDVGTLEFGLPGGDVVLQIGQEMVQQVYNDEGVDIPDGTPVYISGAAAGVPYVKVADISTSASSQLLGLTTETILTGTVGYVATIGFIHELNTAAFAAGEKLWLGAAGAITNVMPPAGAGTAARVEVGYCLTSDALQGIILLVPRVIPGLTELSDVLSAALTDGDVPVWVAANSRFEFINAGDVASKAIPWAFVSPAGTTGTFYYGGFYNFFVGNNNFAAPVNFGTANLAHSAHFSVILGELAVDEITITVTGTSTNDLGVTTPADTDTIVIPAAAPVNSYYETPKKWVGTVSIAVTAGTPKQCNYGFTKYWDNANTDFTVTDFEVTWLGGANDAAPNIQLIHHKETGWTYNAGAKPTAPTPIADMAVTLGAGRAVGNGKNGAFKLTNLATHISGSASEGTLWAVTNSANGTFEIGNIQMGIVPEA